jgi:hypothetical protein
MTRILATFILLVINFQVLSQQAPEINFPQKPSIRQFPSVYLAVDTNPTVAYDGFVDEDLSELMVPIPMRDRVFNRTGIQCVWASTEALGRYAEEPKLINLTDDPECKSFANEYSFSRKMKERGVKYKTTTNPKDRSLIIKSVVQDRRGCMFCVPNHAMVLVHYDEKKGIVKYFNNSDRSLAIRTWTMAEFNKRFEGWVSAIYADNDIIPFKYAPQIPNLVIIDRNSQQGIYDKEYILQPAKN